MPENFVAQLLESEKRLLFAPRIPTIISGFTEPSNAKTAGFEKKDQILSVNGVQTKYFDQFKQGLQNNAGKNINVVNNVNVL